MGIKDKKQQIIKEILKQGGALDSASIKERVCARLGISLDHYPKPTYLRHLKELVDNNEIVIDDTHGKNKYELPYNGWDVIGQKYIEDMGHRIFVPKIVVAGGVRIVPGCHKTDECEELYFLLEMGHAFFTLCVHKDAFPFKLHISRAQDFDKPSKLLQKYGQRTIFLEANLKKVSGFKEGDDRMTGHALLSFSVDGSVVIEDLGSSHGTNYRRLTNDDTHKIMISNNNMGRATYLDVEDQTMARKVYLPTEAFKAVEAELPVNLQCSDELFVTLLTNVDHSRNRKAS